MSTGEVRREFRSWSVENHAIRIEYAVPALEEVSAEGVDGLYRFRHGGMEVGGVLFGTAAGDRVRVVTFRPLDCEHAFGPRFVLSERDRAALKDLLYAPRREAELRGLEPVGWYHSHTRSGIELSPRDLEIYDSYFPQRWQIALVVRPENSGPVRAGFFFRERDGTVHAESSYEEFTCVPRRHGLVAVEEPEPEAEVAEPAPPPPPEPRSRRAAAAPTRHRAAPSPAEEVEEARLEPLEVPGFAKTQPWHGKKWIWAALAAALVSAAGFGAARWYVDSAPPPPLSLWVVDLGGQLLIEWDRAARPIRDAQTATLEIQDGDLRITKVLDAEVLHGGNVDYRRIADVIDVRLRVKQRGRDVQDLVRFIGQPVKPVAVTDANAASTRERDALKAELDALKKQMEDKDTQIQKLRRRLALREQ